MAAVGVSSATTLLSKIQNPAVATARRCASAGMTATEMERQPHQRKQVPELLGMFRGRPVPRMLSLLAEDDVDTLRWVKSGGGALGLPGHGGVNVVGGVEEFVPVGDHPADVGLSLEDAGKRYGLVDSEHGGAAIWRNQVRGTRPSHDRVGEPHSGSLSRRAQFACSRIASGRGSKLRIDRTLPGRSPTAKSRC